MTSEVIISAEKLGKKYLIDHQRERERYKSLRDSIARGATSFGDSLKRRLKGQWRASQSTTEEFWALRDVSFHVKRGEVIGIIGRNGAGKSTLLKILSRITEPSEGRVAIRGRVATLLEVGTGFHPELTGRENIYLNGAILGMTSAETRKKFDEIVAFAEVERFLDTPVKRYSSGMYVRLAFAIAAHLEAEILVIDEVLAVGDAEFQKKCLRKMKNVASKDARTILFVSHNMYAVEKLCDGIVELERGVVVNDSSNVREGILRYVGLQHLSCTTSKWVNSGQECQNKYFIPLSLELRSFAPQWQPGEPFENLFPVELIVTGQLKVAERALSIGVAIFSQDKSEPILWSFMNDTEECDWPIISEGYITLRTTFPAHYLNEGAYRAVIIADLRDRVWLHEAEPQSPASCMFTISGGLSKSPVWNRRRPGILAPVFKWDADSNSLS